MTEATKTTFGSAKTKWISLAVVVIAAIVWGLKSWLATVDNDPNTKPDWGEGAQHVQNIVNTVTAPVEEAPVVATPAAPAQ